MFQIAIVEDDQYDLQSLQTALEQQTIINPKTLIYHTAEALLEDIRSGKLFDLLILDIELSGELTGVQLGALLTDMLSSQQNKPQIIFVTNHTKYLPDSFDLNAVWFIVKPIESKVLEKALNRVVSRYYRLNEYFCFKYRGERTCIRVRDILYIETFGRQIQLYTITGEHYTFYGTIKSIAARLEVFHVVQCHRSYIVNLIHVLYTDSKTITMENQVKIPIGNSFVNYLDKCLTRYQLGQWD